MDLQTLTYIVVGLSFALYIGIAIWARAGTTKEFYIAGGGVHPIVNGMATGADWMSAASFISMAGLIAFLGYGGSVYLMGWTGGYVLLAVLLAPYLRKFGKFTVPEFIGDRYYSQTARIVAVIDAFDAMTTDRPYRKALTREVAFEELMRGAGTQFDPKVVKAFMEVLEQEEKDKTKSER